jgi:hypothetical protein
MATTIDTLQLEITSNSSIASTEIDKLANSLTKLKGVGSLKTVATNLQKLSTALQGLSTASSGIANLNNIATAFSGLSGVSTKGMNATVTSLKKIPEIIKQLDTATLDKFAEKMNRINTAVQPLANNLAKAGSGMKSLTDKLKGNANVINKATVNMKGFNSIFTKSNAIFAGLGIVLKKSIDVIGKAVSSMNDYIENMNLFNVSMGTYFDEAKEYADFVQNKMGIDSSEWSRGQGVFMAMARGFGLMNEQAYEMSKGMTELSYDMSSFYNIPIEEALTKMRSAMAGEIEPLRQLGISLTEATLQEIALANGITKKVNAMTEAEKAQLRYVAIVQSANSQGVIGDFARTLESPANAIRILQQQFKQLGRALGSVFLPIITQVMPYVQAFVKVLTSLISRLATFFGFEMPKWTEKDWGANSAKETASAISDATAKAKEYKKSLQGFDELNIIPAPQQSSGGSGAGGVGGDLGLDIKSVWNDETFASISSQVDGLVEKMKNLSFADVMHKLVNSIILYAPDVMQTAGNIVTWLYEGMLVNIPQMILAGSRLITWIGQGLVEGIPNLLTKGLDMLNGFADMLTVNLPILIKSGIGFIKNLVQGVMNSLPVLIAKVPEIISKFANLINDNAPTIIMAGFGIILDIVKGIINAIPTLIANIPKVLKAIFDVWMAYNWIDLGKQALKLLGNGISAMGTWIGTSVGTIKDKIVQTFVNLATKLKSTNPIKGMWDLIVSWYKTAVAPKFTVSYWVNVFKGMKDAFPQVMKNMLNAGIELFNKFIGWINSRLKFTWNDLKIMGQTIVKGGSIQLFTIPSIPRFEDGGFLEDGLFTMNKGEIAGKFNNGKSVVANNQQIIEGISAGVYEAMVRANGNGKDITINATFELDGTAIGKSVVKYHNGVVTQTGMSPLLI